jgi:Tfp pilus assembly protein PilF
MRKVAVLSLFLAILAFHAGAQAALSGLEFAVEPGMSVPISSTDLFGLGFAAAVSARLPLGGLPLLVGPELDAVFQPLQNSSDYLSLVGLGAQARYDLRLGPFFLDPYGQAGYFLGMAAGAMGRSLYFGGGLDLGFALGKAFGLELAGGCRDYTGLYQSIAASLSVDLKPSELKTAGKAPTGPAAPARPVPLVETAVVQGKALEVSQVELDPVFPVLFKYYDDHPVGSIKIKNTSSQPVENLNVSVFVSEYMDNPKLCATIPRIESGAEADAQLFALFNDKLLAVSEGTKVSTKISLEYGSGGASTTQDRVETLRIYDRNASMWDDDRKAAAFVTSKDPTVLRFSKNVMSMVKDKGSRAVNENLLAAMAFHEATRLYGLTYVTDPSDSYAATLQNKTAVDFLQFPRQTLDYKGGNCSALSILYSALLESVGVETAFVTVPGHIFMAVSLGMPPERARKEYLSPDDLILIGDKSWLPIETTQRDSGFVEAWQAAAKEWRENQAKGLAALYPVHDAWALYEPVGFASDMENIALPDADKVASAYLQELVHYIDGEIYPAVTKIQAEIKSSNSSPKSLNALGVLYAHYGLDDRAKEQFKKALAKGDYPYALINLGNLDYLEGSYQESLDFYQRAQKLVPSNPTLLLALARANHELENYGVAKVAYDRLKIVDPDLASRYGYLELKGEEGTRAANVAGLTDQVEWGQE